MQQNVISTLKSLTNAHRVSGRSTLKDDQEPSLRNGLFRRQETSKANNEKPAKQTNKKLAKQSKEFASMQSNEHQYDKTTSSSTNLTNDKNSLGVTEDYTGSNYKKAAILYFGEDISVAERSKASILYVYIIISIDSAFVSYIAEINS